MSRVPHHHLPNASRFSPNYWEVNKSTHHNFQITFCGRQREGGWAVLPPLRITELDDILSLYRLYPGQIRYCGVQSLFNLEASSLKKESRLQIQNYVRTQAFIYNEKRNYDKIQKFLKAAKYYEHQKHVVFLISINFLLCLCNTFSLCFWQHPLVISLHHNE